MPRTRKPKPIISAEADGTVEWSTSDANALRTFLIGESGQRLCARLRYAVQVINASAVQAADLHRSGDAAGYMRCVSDLQQLSASIAAPDEQEEAKKDERSALERLT